MYMFKNYGFQIMECFLCKHNKKTKHKKYWNIRPYPKTEINEARSRLDTCTCHTLIHVHVYFKINEIQNTRF